MEKISQRYQDILFLIWSGISINKACKNVDEKKRFLNFCNENEIKIASKIGILPTNKEITTDDLFNEAKRGIYSNASINVAWAKLAVHIKEYEEKEGSKTFTPEDYEDVVINKFTILKGKEDGSEKNGPDKNSQTC